MASTIQIRVDDELKSKSDSLFRDLGTATTSAIRMFLTQAVASNGFPFEIKKNISEQNPYRTMTEGDFMSKLVASRKHASEGKLKDSSEVISNLRAKYEV